ncbi:type I-F CRISPR-associated endonuclease Cas1f [Massilia sp. W12]|uniref:type I-F CRISPR-associated endonuclease Cas1f n=1 Tax=Massilia sp. W12 TaxID=3126507 RepID=UPI0030D0046B
MEDFSPSDLKSILHSKRANLYYLEHCRVLVNGGRVEYVTDEGSRSLYWNIPIANTSFILLGTGCSVSQPAMREFARAGVMVGFCGGGGTPLIAGSEWEQAVEWISPQSEYRPTEFLQHWCSFWYQDAARLDAAKHFQTVRAAQIRQHWLRLKHSRDDKLALDEAQLESILQDFSADLPGAASQTDILNLEARLTKQLYKTMAQLSAYGEFTRGKRGSGVDPANRFLDHGNYLAYGLAASATWVLGLPHGLAILHGKTRRGGLVFDVADLIKDALILPQAFLAAAAGDDESAFRQRCINAFHRAGALDVMIDTLKETALRFSQVGK